MHRLYLDLAVEVTNVADNSVVLHLNDKGLSCANRQHFNNNKKKLLVVALILEQSKNLHEMFAGKDISTAGGGDKDVAPVDAILNCCDLNHFKFNSIKGG